MHILSWNVNGIRAVIKKGFLNFLKKEKPDILFLQETKIDDTARNKEKFNFPDYEEFWNSAQRPGYSGTLTLIHNNLTSKIKNKINGIKIKKFDTEGRTQTLEFNKFYLINTYFPNANHELSRLSYKLEFDNELLKYVKKLERKKPVIIGGDFNVAHQEIDIARPKDNIGNAGFTYEERGWMDKFLSKALIDTFRYFNPNKIQYSWWSYRFDARSRNIGWRLDYFCVSKKIIKNVKKSYALDKIMGSDHCPIGIEIKT